MSKTIKVIAIIAAMMIALGIILTGIGVAAGGLHSIQFDKQRGFFVDRVDKTFHNSNVNREQQDLSDFTNLDIVVGLYDISFVPGDEFRLEYTYYEELGKLNITQENGTLKITESKKWDTWRQGFNLYGGRMSNPTTTKLTLYYPETAQFEDVQIKNEAGNFNAKNLQADHLAVEMDLGQLRLEDVIAKNLTIISDAGDCTLKEVNADQAEISLDLGALKTTNFLTKGLEIENDAGSINLQGTFLGENKISCDLGSVTFKTTLKKEEYNYDLNVDLGSVSINGKHESKDSVTHAGAKNNISVDTSAGEVKLIFGN